MFVGPQSFPQCARDQLIGIDATKRQGRCAIACTIASRPSKSHQNSVKQIKSCTEQVALVGILDASMSMRIEMIIGDDYNCSAGRCRSRSFAVAVPYFVPLKNSSNVCCVRPPYVPKRPHMGLGIGNGGWSSPPGALSLSATFRDQKSPDQPVALSLTAGAGQQVSSFYCRP